MPPSFFEEAEGAEFDEQQRLLRLLAAEAGVRWIGRSGIPNESGPVFPFELEVIALSGLVAVDPGRRHPSECGRLAVLVWMAPVSAMMPRRTSPGGPFPHQAKASRVLQVLEDPGEAGPLLGRVQAGSSMARILGGVREKGLVGAHLGMFSFRLPDAARWLCCQSFHSKSPTVSRGLWCQGWAVKPILSPRRVCGGAEDGHLSTRPTIAGGLGRVTGPAAVKPQACCTGGVCHAPTSPSEEGMGLPFTFHPRGEIPRRSSITRCAVRYCLCGTFPRFGRDVRHVLRPRIACLAALTALHIRRPRGRDRVFGLSSRPLPSREDGQEEQPSAKSAARPNLCRKRGFVQSEIKKRARRREIYASFPKVGIAIRGAA